MNKNKIGSNQHKTKFRYHFWASLWFIAFVTMLNVLIIEKTRTEPLSPCPAEGCSIETVQAAPPTIGQKATIVAYVYQVFSNSGHTVAMKAIKCFDSESKFDPMATHVNNNGSVDRGIAQINSYAHPTMTDPYNYQKNIDYAYKLYLQRGFKPWYAPACR